MSAKITQKASGKTEINLEEIITDGENQRAATSALHKHEIKETDIASKKERNKLRSEGLVLKPEMSEFLRKCVWDLTSSINSVRSGLPPSVKISAIGQGTGNNVRVEVAEIDGEIYAITKVLFRREVGTGWWGPSACEDINKRWEYNAPNGGGNAGRLPTNGADLISLFNNGWDTHGKVVYYTVRYKYKDKKGFTHKSKRGLTSGGKPVRKGTKTKNAPLLFVSRGAKKLMENKKDIRVFLNESLYTLDGLGAVGSVRATPWDNDINYFTDDKSVVNWNKGVTTYYMNT